MKENENVTEETQQPAFTQDQLNAINRVVSLALKQKSAKQEKFQEDMLAMIEDLKTSKTEQAAQPADGERKRDPELEAMKKSLEQMTKQLESERNEKIKLSNEQREIGTRGKLEAALRAAGVANPDLLAGASELLYRRISYSEDGSAIMKSAGEFAEDTDIAKGVSEWAKGPGKAYMPAVQASGSGTQRVTGTPSRNASPIDAYNERRNNALDGVLAAAGILPD